MNRKSLKNYGKGIETLIGSDEADKAVEKILCMDEIQRFSLKHMQKHDQRPIQFLKYLFTKESWTETFRSAASIFMFFQKPRNCKEKKTNQPTHGDDSP